MIKYTLIVNAEIPAAMKIHSFSASWLDFSKSMHLVHYNNKGKRAPFKNNIKEA